MFEMMPWRKGGGKELTRFRGELDNLFNRFFDLDWPVGTERIADALWRPRLDLINGDKEITVKVELPGVEAKEIDIALEGRSLTIKGEKKQESETKEDNYQRMERSYGYFSRSLQLPAEVDQDKVDASYKKGVLKIVLRKTKASETKKIEIKTS
jgi:HSP20 family protein